MSIAIGLVILILTVSVAGTLFVMLKEDKKYSSSTKQNTTNMAAIYVVFFALLAVGTAWFIVSS